jgi:NAD(P)-dependent dehydrogenase (short-subunit alcohol dehydrogenase family)
MKSMPVDPKITAIIPAIRAILTQSGLSPMIRCINSEEVSAIGKSRKKFTDILDGVDGIFIDESSTEKIIKSFAGQQAESKFISGLVYIRDTGLLGVGFSMEEATHYLDEFLKGSTISIPEEVEKGGRVQNKIFIVTGGALGFGRGIIDEMVDEGGYAIIADINREAGLRTEAEINGRIGSKRSLFVPCDVTDPGSVKNLVYETVKEFGGIDVLISNAGVLKAGNLEEIDEKTFDFVTDVNYKGFFICAKYSSLVMKLQHQYNPGMFMDIIQINSKSGLMGSNRNFAYSGSKFGAIGLVQSFALELLTHHIKVNAICHGNYFEGPLWSDPKEGLFAQYLKTGKVPGAKNVEDVRKYYEAKVPMGRGCKPKDIVRAVYYLIEQEYETGQAIPVTGGQIMLN